MANETGPTPTLPHPDEGAETVSARPFKAHPTLEDLDAFAAEQRELETALRAACRRSYDAEAEGRRLSKRASERTVRKFSKTGEVGDGRDLMPTGRTLSRLGELAEQAAAAEQEVAQIQRRIEASREGRQMEAYDYDLYLSSGLELPPRRRVLYDENARRAAELLDVARDTLAFFGALNVPEPREITRLRAAVGDGPPDPRTT